MSTLKAGLFPVSLFFADDEETYDKVYKKSDCSLFDGDSAKFARFPAVGCGHTICTDSDNGLEIIVGLGEQDTEEMANSIIIHESVHVWQFTKKAINEKHPGIETEAYAIQYFATWMIQERAKNQAKRNKKNKKKRH